MSEVTFLILIIILTVAVGIIVPQWRIRRASRQVIAVFREHGAVDAKSARTAQELGLAPPGLLGHILSIRRDFKPQALITLMQVGIIQETDNDGLYLSEEKLSASRLSATLHTDKN